MSVNRRSRRGVPVATFTRDMMIRDALLLHEGASEVFVRHGLGCGHCMAAEMETLAAVAVMHEISVEVLIDDLNALGPVDGEVEDA
jgi:hybrid cluster-associated redox disulfide protein